MNLTLDHVQMFLTLMDTVHDYGNAGRVKKVLQGHDDIENDANTNLTGKNKGNSTPQGC